MRGQPGQSIRPGSVTMHSRRIQVLTDGPFISSFNLSMLLVDPWNHYNSCQLEFIPICTAYLELVERELLVAE